jgi:hypothetical protein
MPQCNTTQKNNKKKLKNKLVDDWFLITAILEHTEELSSYFTENFKYNCTFTQ